MTGQELFRKDVIQPGQGAKLGRVDDVWFEEATCQLQGVILYAHPRWMFWKSKERDLLIPWNRIVSIGQDVILVELEEEMLEKDLHQAK